MYVCLSVCVDVRKLLYETGPPSKMQAMLGPEPAQEDGRFVVKLFRQFCWSIKLRIL